MNDYESQSQLDTSDAVDTSVPAAEEESIVPTRPAGHRRNRKKRGPGCIIALVIVAILGGLGYWGVSTATSALQDMLGPPDDYSGNGKGKVVVEVENGATTTEIARTLEDEGVIASVEAFTDAAAAEPESQTIQPGFYKLADEMSAEAALGRLMDSDFRTEGMVVVPEGARSDQVVEAIAEGSKVKAGEVEKAIESPRNLGLPAYADGEVEGLLFPATYQVAPDATAAGVLRSMVKKAKQEHNELNLDAKAAQLGISPRQALIVASLIEKEVSRDEDRAKVARVIYNRLSQDMPLQLDSTVHYVAERSGDVFTTDEEREIDSPYNTYENTGLPPGPIDSPGAEALKAALNPAKGDWTYFVTVNLESGETLFASSLQEHNKNVEKLHEYCDGSDLC